MVLCLLASTVVNVVACSAEPVATPTPTPAFANEEEAFAAAEEVYRAYNDAANARANSDDGPPDPRDFLTGLALEGDIDAQNAFHEAGIHLRGAASIASFSGVRAHLESASASISAVVCIDVTAVRVVDSSGLDVTPADRGDMVAQRVTLIGTPAQLMISEESSAEVSSC